MLLKGIKKVKELYNYKREKAKLIKTIELNDLINYGLSEQRAAICENVKALHSYIIGIIRYDDAQFNNNNLHRYRDCIKEAKRLKEKLGLDRKTLFLTWKNEATKHKGEGVGVGAIYYETAGLYITFVKKRG